MDISIDIFIRNVYFFTIYLRIWIPLLIMEKTVLFSIYKYDYIRIGW